MATEFVPRTLSTLYDGDDVLTSGLDVSSADLDPFFATLRLYVWFHC